jgi:hypothetical protein
VTPAPAVTATTCGTVGGRQVAVAARSADGIFTHAPFLASEVAIITNGEETNDPRFAYPWIRNAATTIYAPADGVLIRIRHKAPHAGFAGDDYDLIFLAACDPSRAGASDTLFRFNHITDPRPDLKAAYGYGALPAPDLSVTPTIDYEERQVPVTNIAVRAGEVLGSTTGNNRNFDFMIAINDVTVCPFTPLAEPHRSALLAMLGPKTASPFGPPQAGYPCRGYGPRP